MKRKRISAENDNSVQKNKKAKYGDIQKLMKPKKTRKSETQTFLQNWFDELKTEKDKIGPEGVELFCSQIELESDSLEIMLFCYLIKLSEMGFIKKHEFLEIENHFEIKKKSNLKKELKTLASGLSASDQISKKLHNFAFDFCREKEKRIIDKETAKQMITCLYKYRWKYSNQFIQYLEESNYRGMNRDQWINIFEFFNQNIKINNYDSDGAWPVMMDEFVEFLKNKNLD